MAALRELQALEASDGIADEVTLDESAPSENDNDTDDDFFEEFPSLGDNPQQRDDQGDLDAQEWAEAVRKASKTIVQPGTYSQRRSRSMWGNRFDTFRKDILKQDCTKQFKSNELETFILYFFRRYQPKQSQLNSEDEDQDEDQDEDTVESAPKDDIKPRTKWSYTALKDAKAAIKQRSTFRWENFQLTTKKEQRIQGAIERMLEDGYASKQEVISRDQALGVYFVRRIARGILQHAMDGNMHSCDSAILFTLAIVLQAALNCRIGDILAHNKVEEWTQDQQPSLAYHDVKLVLDGDKIEDIKGEWTVRNAKGSNGDPAKAYRLDRHALLGNSDNSLCPVRLVLINALRHGNVKGGNTIEEVLAQAATHPLRRIEWIDPQLPVISHVTPAHTVLRNKPMKASTMAMAFSLVQHIVDADVSIRSHDIRYGAAEDLLHIVRGQQMGLSDIAQELNHSTASANKGLTRKYTKKSSVHDTWQARVNLPDQSPTFTSVIFNANLTAQPRSGDKRKLSDIERESVMYGDGTNFVNHLAQVADPNQPIVLQLPKVSATHDSNLPMTRVHTRPRANTFSTNGRFPCQLEDCCLEAGGAFHTIHYLQAHELKFHNKYLPARCPVYGCEKPEPLTSFQELAAHIQDHLEPQSHKAHVAYYTDCREEACPFSFPRNTPDVYQNHLRKVHRLRQAVPTKAERGDNRHSCLVPSCDHKERFLNGDHAAGTLAPYTLHLANDHGLKSPDSRAVYQLKFYTTATAWLQYVLPVLAQESPAVAEEEPESASKASSKPVCTLPDCTKKGKKECKDKRALQEHVVSQHRECYPAACPVDGCLETNFATYDALDKHMKNHHLRYAIGVYETDTTFNCRSNECTDTFKTKATYLAHLKKVHSIKNPGLLDHEKARTYSCYVEGCDATVKFSKTTAYDTHLVQIHNLHSAAQRRIYLKGTVSRWLDNYASIVYAAHFPTT